MKNRNGARPVSENAPFERLRPPMRQAVASFVAGIVAVVILPMSSLAFEGELRLRGHEFRVTSAMFSPDGKRVLTECASRLIVHDAASGAKAFTVKTEGGNGHAAVYSPDGEHIAAVVGGAYKRFEAATGKELFATKGHQFGRFADGVLAFSPDGKLIVVSHGIVDATNGETRCVFKDEDGKDVEFHKHAFFFPDGRRLVAIVTHDHKDACVLVDLPEKVGAAPTEVRINEADILGPAIALAVSPNGRLLALCGSTQAELWDVASRKPLGSPLEFTRNYSACLAFSPDGKCLAVGRGKSVVLLEAESQKRMDEFVIAEAESEASSLAFSPDGARLVVGLGEAPSAVLWSVQRELEKKRAQERVAAETRTRLAKEREDRLAQQAEEQRVLLIEAERRAKQQEQMAAIEAEKRQAAAEAKRRDDERRAENLLPEWPAFTNLGLVFDEFEGCGDGLGEYVDDRLKHFVLYETVENARKAIRGDRFDKDEAAESASAHRASLASRCFFLQRTYEWDESAKTAPNAIVIRIRLPFRCRVPGMSAVGTRDIIEDQSWYLDETGRLRPCATPQEAAIREQNGQEIYLRENAYFTTLTVRVEAPREVLKAIARNPSAHVVNVGVQRLRLERPATRGFFRLGILREDGFDTNLTRGHHEFGVNGAAGAPHYFVPKEPEGTAIAEAIMCDLQRLEIVSATPEHREVVFEWSSEKSEK